MKRNAVWLVPGFVAVAALIGAPACSSSDDELEDSTLEADGGAGNDSGSKTDSSTQTDADTAKDATPFDSSTDSGDAGQVDAYVRACARIDACAAATTTQIGMNGCYKWITALPFRSSLRGADLAAVENLECKLAATTCAGVKACDKPLADYTAFCNTKDFGGTYCSGNVAVACDFVGDDETMSALVANDCTAAGNVCGENGMGSGGCGKQACVQDTYTSTCNGTKLTECTYWGVTRETDCSLANTTITLRPVRSLAFSTCGSNGADVPANECISDGPACTGATSRCDGTVLETCTKGHLTRRDCATVLPAGQGCTALGDDVPFSIQTVFACGPVNPTCKAADNETCDAATGVISFCGLTETKTADCKAMGYAGCKTTTVDGRVAASCF